MKDILKDKHFSVEFFNQDGIEEVVELFNGNYEEIRYEMSMGNFLIGQTPSGRLYFFCETDEPQNEITFNSVKRLVDKANA